MNINEGYLVIGADSMVGRELISCLRDRGHHVLSTTRRKENVHGEVMFLDFEDSTSFFIPAGVKYAYVVAAATNYERCEKDPNAQVVNVELIPKLVSFLVARGIHVAFVSTNSVFGGNVPWPDEDYPHSPGIPYAKQKSESEKKMYSLISEMGALTRLGIVRLTKVLESKTSPIPSWIASWERGDRVEPFADLIFSPISARYVAESLATIGERRVFGNLHLSGAENITYVDFASALAAKLNIPDRLILPTTAVAKGVNIPFKPKYSGIGMSRTTKITGLIPQHISSVVEDLLDNSK